MNGKRNGKGKEYYDNGHLKFEGEYLNGEKHGIVKEYYNYGHLKFEGEYLNGKRNGKGKNYDYNYDLEFEGEYLKGQKLKVIAYINKAKEYEGENLNGRIWNGKGYDDGNIIYILNNGNGKVLEYSDKCVLEFEGEYLD